MFVEVDGKPIRASRKSAQWCLDAVDVCWKQKVKQTREAEQAAAADAYQVARTGLWQNTGRVAKRLATPSANNVNCEPNRDL